MVVLIKTMKNILLIFVIIEFCFSKTISISGSIFNNQGKPSRKAEVKLYTIDESQIGLVKTKFILCIKDNILFNSIPRTSHTVTTLIQL